MSDLPGRVLTRGPFLLPPLEKISHFPHHQLLKRGLQNCGLTEFNFLQKTVVPHFLRGDDIFITGGQGSGKSLSYLIPLLGKLVNDSDDEEPGPSNQNLKNDFLGFNRNRYNLSGPQVIIVCYDKKSAIKIEGHLFNLIGLGVQRKISYKLVCEGKDIQKKLSEDADILVTTAYILAHLWQSPTCLRFDRFSCIVLDDFDVLLRTYPEQVEVIQNVISNIAVGHHHRSIQRVFCCGEWSPRIEEFYMSLKHLGGNDAYEFVHQKGLKMECVPTFFINSPNQAIQYAGIKLIMEHTTAEQKMPYLICLLKSLDVFKHKSVFVVCNAPETAKQIFDKLSSNDIDSYLAETSKMTEADFQQTENYWNNLPNSRKVMVLNNEALRGLRIYDATCLIHYEMPIKNPYIKSATGVDRFTCMWSHFRDITEEKMEPASKLDKIQLESYFLLTGTENALYKLKIFASKMGYHMPQSLAEIADKAGKEMTEKLPLCEGIKLFGKCMEAAATNCRARHFFISKELEVNPIVPRNGEIEVEMAECTNPSLYTGRVLRYFEYKDGKRVTKEKSSWIPQFQKITKELDEHFKSEKNNVRPSSFQVGSRCVVKNSQGIFRARILQIYTRTDNNYPKQLRVFCIDTGYFMQPIADHLFQMPPHLENVPQLAVFIILANLIPLDSANGFSSAATSKARDLVENKILNGRIHFSVGETVWLNPLVDLARTATEEDSMKTRSSIRLDLIHSKHAENNESHMQVIYELGRNTGFQCPELEDIKDNPIKDYTFMEQFFDLGEKYQWAFMETSSPEDPTSIDVWTSFTKDPNWIFGTQKKFDGLLYYLNEDLNKEILDFIMEKCSKYETKFSSWYKAGLVVAVKDRENENWIRGIIRYVHTTHDDDDEDSLTYSVFFVDVGVYQHYCTTKELFPMPRKFVKRLPFQAIAFKLSHVSPLSGSTWNKESIEALMNCTLAEDDDRVLLDVVALKSLRHRSLECKYYCAIMYTESNKDIGEILVQKGVASFTTNGEQMVNLTRDTLIARLNELYNRQHKEIHSDSDDDDENDNSVAALDYDSDGGFDIVGFDTQKILNTLGIASEDPQLDQLSLSDNINNNNNANDTDGEKPSTSKELKKQKVGGFSSIRHPNVYWKQTNEEIVLKIDLPDVQEYTVEVQADKKTLTFRTIIPANYGFDIEFFGKIENDPKPTVFCTGQYMTITLKKRIVWHWSRPLSTETKLHWFKEDINNIDTSDDESEAPFAPPNINLANDEDGGSSSSSTDDEFDPDIAETAE